MRLLVMGGTQFVGRHIAEIGIERGHEVTVFHRGTSNADAVPKATHVIGDRDTDLERLAGGEWDATIDVSAYVPRQVNELARRAGRPWRAPCLRVDRLGVHRTSAAELQRGRAHSSSCTTRPPRWSMTRPTAG